MGAKWRELKDIFRKELSHFIATINHVILPRTSNRYYYFCSLNESMSVVRCRLILRKSADYYIAASIYFVYVQIDFEGF